LKLEVEYTSSAQNMLKELGLPPNSQFIAIHVRNKSKFNLDDNRRANVKNYEMAVSELIKMGYWVVQFGTDEQDLVLNNPKVIKIPSSESRTIFLTPYLISFAKIFINTCSGPTHLSPLFNTPVLQTNVIALGKNTCNLTDKSIHLPKKWKINNRYLSLYELLNSLEGYSDSGIRNLNKKGIELIENTPTEIYEAVLDILNSVDHCNGFTSNTQIDNIRISCNSPVRGNFAPSFVQANENWFLQ
jgi:putative glycosyltransferase (TIGR04372 family)